jgi:hypothetical protein
MRDTYAPEQYFGFFKLPRVKVYVVPTTDGTSAARHVLERLLSLDLEDDDERWILLDTDHYVEKQHYPGFIAAISEARQKGVQVALSKPCFELWLLLHHVNEREVARLENAAMVQRQLRVVLNGYNKTRLRPEDFPMASVAAAYECAERLDRVCTGGDKSESNTSRVYLFWRSIIEKSAPAQLPLELRGLKERLGQ